MTNNYYTKARTEMEQLEVDPRAWKRGHDSALDTIKQIILETLK